MPFCNYPAAYKCDFFALEWFFLALAASLFWATSALADKHILHNYVRNPYPGAVVGGIIAFAIAQIIAFAVPLAEISVEAKIAGLLAGATIVFGTSLYLRALCTAEVSVAAAAINTCPLFVMLFAFLFIGERLQAFQYAAILLIVVGAVFLSLEKPPSLNLGKSAFRAGMPLLFFTTLVFAVSVIFRKYAVDASAPLAAFYWFAIGAFLASLVFLAFKWKCVKRALEKAPKAFGFMAASSLAAHSGTMLSLSAMSLGAVSLVSAMASFYPLFVLLGSIAIARVAREKTNEKIDSASVAHKLAAIAMIIAGSAIATQ